MGSIANCFRQAADSPEETIRVSVCMCLRVNVNVNVQVRVRVRTEHGEKLARVEVEPAPRGAQLLVRGHVLAHVELGLRAERVEHTHAAPAPPQRVCTVLLYYCTTVLVYRSRVRCTVSP